MFAETALSEQSIAAQGIVAAGSAEMIGTSSKASIGVGILVGATDIISSFTQTNIAGKIFFRAVVEIDSSFTQTSNVISIANSGELDLLSNFTQSALGGLLRFGISEMSFNFTQSSDGGLLWEAINANANTESWAPIVHTGGTWTPINASGTIEQWTEKVV